MDLIVNFDTTDHEKWDYVTNYFDFQEALEKIFDRKIDLVVLDAINEMQSCFVDFPKRF